MLEKIILSIDKLKNETEIPKLESEIEKLNELKIKE
jgi:hypothetical protein